MPSDVIAIAVSTGIGVSVFAGVLSGICYILVHGFTRRSREAVLQWYCVVCGNYLRSRGKEFIKAIICVECEERACKHQCSKRGYAENQWICYNCLKRPSWLQSVLTNIRLSYQKFNKVDNTVREESDDQMEEKQQYSVLKSKEEKECIRDFIEKLVCTIIEGSVDDASIFRIYNDRHYQAFFDKYQQDLSDAITTLSSTLQLSINNSSYYIEQDPSEAHTTLKSLIETIIREAAHLPKFQSVAKNPISPNYKNERTYEELLATAILNKIQQRVEEIPSTIFHDDVEKSLQYLRYDNPSSLGHRQSNWYLQKRKIQNTSSPVPVPMLVPNPSTSAKVLIGDTEADETSDLSDGNSYLEDNSDPGAENLLVKSTVIIGERFNYLSDEDTSFDSGVREDKEDFMEQEKCYPAKHTKTNIADDLGSGRVSPTSIHSNVEKDSEYTEQYSSLPKAKNRHLSEDLHQLLWLMDQQHESSSFQNFDSQEYNQVGADENNEVFEGIYSKKEKDKWNHPVSMPNNPYSKENIRKRIQLNQRYGRDYYTKQASLPSGSLKSEETNSAFWTIEETSVYKAWPVRTTDSETEIQSDEYYTESTTSEPSETITASNVHLNTNADNFELYHELFETNSEELKTSVNAKNAPDVNKVVHNGASDPVDTVTNIIADNVEIDQPDSDIQVNEVPNNRMDSSPQVSRFYKTKDKTTIKNNTVIQTFESTLLKENQSPAVIAKKSDNTLIRKIYSNPIVRNFALSNREKIPYLPDIEINKTISPRTEPKDDTSISKLCLYDIPSSSENESGISEANCPKYNFSLEFSDNESLRKQNTTQNGNEYNELKERRLVSNLIGEYSKSFPNITKINLLNYDRNKNKVLTETSEKRVEKKEVENVQPSETYVSVKDLKKLFETSNDTGYGKDKPVHSLTARSISKEMKEKLRTYNDTKADTLKKSKEEDNKN